MALALPWIHTGKLGKGEPAVCVGEPAFCAVPRLGVVGAGSCAGAPNIGTMDWIYWRHMQHTLVAPFGPKFWAQR